MNNNRNNANNRRRGRGNRNQGGGSQGNRIDSRARGNAPQLLDKYKKLAEDAHRNGDRVQAEYYLQFADHYFRVIADNRARQDEQRGGSSDQQRGNWRRDGGDGDDFDMADEDEGGEDGREPPRREAREPREDRGNRDGRRDRQRRDDNRPPRSAQPAANGAVEGNEGDAYQPDDNPFTRDPRGNREPRENREDRPRRTRQRNRRDDDGAGAGESIDASILPPAFSANDSGASEGASTEGETEVAPRPRRKRGDSGTLSALG